MYLSSTSATEPSISKGVQLVIMGGSIYRGYNNSTKPVAEYNIATNVSAAQRVLNSEWHSPPLFVPIDPAVFFQVS